MHLLNLCKFFRWNSLSRMEMNYFPKFFLGAIFCNAVVGSGGESRVQRSGSMAFYWRVVD